MLRLWPILALFLLGCSPPAYTFEAVVVNKSTLPLSAGFVKDGPPGESAWTAPEDVLIGAPRLAEKHWGTLVPAGERVVIGPTKGHFPRGVRGYLRIYGADRTISELIGYSRGDPDRLDVEVYPGRNVLIINNRAGRLTAVPADEAPPAVADPR